MNAWVMKYEQPAGSWTEALPLGNGRLGAMVYGGDAEERWSLTEVTHWSGKPEHIGVEAGARERLDEIRQHFFAGNYDKGEQLARKWLQPAKGNYGTNLPVCDVLLRFDAALRTDYIRELDLNEAMARVRFESEGVRFSREVWISHPDEVMVARLSCDTPGALSFAVHIDGYSREFESRPLQNDTLMFAGRALENNHSDGQCGVSSYGLVRVVAQGGRVSSSSTTLAVEGADEVYIYLALATDYGKETSADEWTAMCCETLEAAASQGYETLRARHTADYKRLFERTDLQLGAAAEEEAPTDARLRGLRGGGDDSQLLALFFQYGRYLTIAGSRENSPLPMHLQGIWNDNEASRMQWSCDYHLDINTQMNYYPVEVCNLAECHLPLLRLIRSLSEAGRVSARNFYGCEGWVAHVFTNAWGFTAPGWDTFWGLHVTGGLWIATHLIEHYEYAPDPVFLARDAYPALAEAARFYLDYMVVDPDRGWLVTGPSNSPENSFYLEVDQADQEEQGRAYHLSMGATLDQVLVRRLFEFCLMSARQMGTDPELQARLEEALPLLPPLQTGRWGQLREWLEDYPEAMPEHRHLSHLVALHPLDQISLRTTPELAAAAKVTLDSRLSGSGLEDIEFTRAAAAAFYARLEDGEQTLGQLRHLAGQLSFDNLLTYSKPGVAGAECNIFVIDGNLGGTAAIAEMLLQSRIGELRLLPALPQSWQQGYTTGLRAKGNMEVDLYWEKGRLTQVYIHAYADQAVTVCYRDRVSLLLMEAGRTYVLDGDLAEVKQ